MGSGGMTPALIRPGRRQRELRDDPGGLVPIGKRKITPGTPAATCPDAHAAWKPASIDPTGQRHP